MKGTNFLNLSQETMCEVVQEWIDHHTHMVHAKVVKVIEYPPPSDDDPGPPRFLVRLEPKEET